MASLVFLLAVLVFGTFFVLSLRRARELFALEVFEDDVKLKRGRIPPSLLQDVREILAKAPARGTLRVIAHQGSPVVQAHGSFREETLQRVRNVVGMYSVIKLRAGRPAQGR